MSVINRMLSDLERRGAPSPQAGEQEMRAAAPQRRRRRVSRRAGLGMLAVVLVVLAVALWVQRGDRIMAVVPPLSSSDSPAAEPLAPELVGVSFDRAGEDERLELRVDGAMDRAPRYSRSGGGATLVVDARAGDLVLPAPPPGQDVFRGIAIGSDASPRTRIRLEVDPSAELALQVEDGRIELVGRLPGAEMQGGDSAETATLASADTPETAERDIGAGEAGANTNTTTKAARSTERAETADAGGTNEGEPASSEGATTDNRNTTDARTVAEAPQAASASTGETASGGEPAPEPAGVGGDANGDTGDAAEGEVRKSRSTSPETLARRRYQEGRDAIARGELTAARRALGRALDLDPSLHAARDLLVGLLRRAGDTVTARRLLAEGVERSPGRVEYALPYARLLVDTGDLDRAAAVLEDARGNGAGAAGYHALVAALAQRRGRHRAAASEYTRALEAEPGNGLWWLGLGVSLSALDKPDEARAAFREARSTGTLSASLDRWVQGRIEELGTGKEG